jgi:glutathione S-transferase
VQADIARIIAIFEECRARHAAAGDFLFGRFTVADAMFAPVATRFRSYSVTLPTRAQAYADALLALAPMREWVSAGVAESERFPDYEALVAAR